MTRNASTAARSSFAASGYNIHRGVLALDEIAALREETDRVAAAAGKPCVRALRSQSEILRNLATDPRLITLLAAETEMIPVRSILFDKTPQANWLVAWHQDLTIAVSERRVIPGYCQWTIKEGIVHVQPPVAFLAAMRTARIHLDETSAMNGALRVLEGSQRRGRIPTEAIADTVAALPERICECCPGDVLIMQPLLVHASRRAHAATRRRVLHFEYAPAHSLPPELGWHEAP